MATFTHRWNFTVGEVQLMLIEGEEGAGQSCDLSWDANWELHVDSLRSLLYPVDR